MLAFPLICCNPGEIWVGQGSVESQQGIGMIALVLRESSTSTFYTEIVWFPSTIALFQGPKKTVWLVNTNQVKRKEKNPNLDRALSRIHVPSISHVMSRAWQKNKAIREKRHQMQSMLWSIPSSRYEGWCWWGRKAKMGSWSNTNVRIWLRCLKKVGI